MKQLKIISEFISFLLAFILLFYITNTSNPNYYFMDKESRQSSPKINQKIIPLTSLVKANIFIFKNKIHIQEEIHYQNKTTSTLFYFPANIKSNATLKSVTLSNNKLNYSSDNTNIEINTPILNPQITYFDYEIDLKENNSLLTYLENEYYLLTNFLVTPEVYHKDKLIRNINSKFGDPYVYNTYNYMISINCENKFNVFAPGNKSSFKSDNTTNYIFTAENLRDFSIFLYNSDLQKNVFEETHNQVNFHFYNSKELSNYVYNSFDFAEKNIGRYPYKDLFVISVPLSQKGMELSNIIILNENDKILNEQKINVVYHEIFHQWFYFIIGTDQINEPFLDEGIVSFLSSLLANKISPTKKNITIANKPLSQYQSITEYYQEAYYDFETHINNLYLENQNFYDILKKIYSTKKFSILYYDDFKTYFND